MTDQVTSEIEEFNRVHPVGTRVRIYPLRTPYEAVETRTASVAHECHGQAVVRLADWPDPVWIGGIEIVEKKRE